MVKEAVTGRSVSMSRERERGREREFWEVERVQVGC